MGPSYGKEEWGVHIAQIHIFKSSAKSFYRWLWLFNGVIRKIIIAQLIAVKCQLN